MTSPPCHVMSAEAEAALLRRLGFASALVRTAMLGNGVQTYADLRRVMRGMGAGAPELLDSLRRWIESPAAATFDAIVGVYGDTEHSGRLAAEVDPLFLNTCDATDGPFLFECAHVAPPMTMSQVGLSPDGTRCVSIPPAYASRRCADICSLDFRPCAPPCAPLHAQRHIGTLAWSANGARVALCSGTTVRVWDAATATLLRSMTCARSPWEVCLSSDGSLLAIAFLEGGTIVSVDGDENGPLFVFAFGEVNGMAFSPDGSEIAVGTGSGQVHLCKVADGGTPHHTFLTHPGVNPVDGSFVAAVVYSPDGATLAVTCHGYAAVIVWSLTTHDRLFTADDPAQFDYTAVAFSHDGALLATARSDGLVTLLSTATYSAVQTVSLLTGIRTGEYGTLAFTLDGRRVVVVVSDWDRVRRGRERREIHVWHRPRVIATCADDADADDDALWGGDGSDGPPAKRQRRD